jgi:hypothetical protein
MTTWKDLIGMTFLCILETDSYFLVFCDAFSDVYELHKNAL